MNTSDRLLLLLCVYFLTLLISLIVYSHLEDQPQLLDFIEGLQLNNDDKELHHLDRSTWLKDCSLREVEKFLQDKMDGTFLVRPLKQSDTPYCVCVMYVLLKTLFEP